METLYDRLEALLNDLLNNDLNVRAAERKIEQAFSDSYINIDDTDQAYFQEYRTDIYLKDSNGLSISFISGKGDIYGDMHSYNGSTITLYDVYNNEIYELYSENELQRQTVNELVQNLPKIMADREDFRLDLASSITDPFYLYTMDKNDIYQNPEIIKTLLDKLWIEADVRYSSEYDDYMISPYGGEDVTVHPTTEHFLNLISKFNDFPIFEEASKEYLLSKPESIDFLNKVVENLKKKICYVDNKETYHKLNELQKKQDIIEFEEMYDNNRYAEIIANEKKENILQYQKAVTELEALQDKKYTVFDRLKKFPKQEYEYLAEQVQIKKENLDDVLKREQKVNQIHEELKAVSDNIQKEIEEIMDKNNLSPLHIDHPIYSFETFDELMYPYTKNYNTNVATLARYKAILDLGTNRLQKDPIYGVKKNIEVAKEAETKTKKTAKKSIKKNINRV